MKLEFIKDKCYRITSYERFVYNVTGIPIYGFSYPLCSGMNVVAEDDKGYAKLVKFNDVSEFANAVMRYDGKFVIMYNDDYDEIIDEYRRRFNTSRTKKIPYYIKRKMGIRYPMNIDKNIEELQLLMYYGDGTTELLTYNIPLGSGDKTNEVYDGYEAKYIQEEAPESVKIFMRQLEENRKYLTTNEDKVVYVKETIRSFWNHLIDDGTNIAVLSVTTKLPYSVSLFSLVRSDDTCLDRLFNEYDLTNLDTITVTMDIKDELLEGSHYVVTRSSGRYVMKTKFVDMSSFITELYNVVEGFETIIVRKDRDEANLYRLRF